MTSLRIAIAGIAALTFSLPGWGQTTYNLTPGQNITAQVEIAVAGDVIQLAPGDYTAANTAAFPFTGSFGIAKGVTIRGMGATPADVRLHGHSGADHVVLFLRYGQPPIGATFGNPTGARLENLTIDGAEGGVQIFDFVYDASVAPPPIRFTDITLRNIVINTPSAGPGFGVFMKKSDRIVLDNVKITSYNAGINLIDVTDSLVMNSTVFSTVESKAPALAVQGGHLNVFVGNTFGNPKADPTSNSGYSFQAGGVVFYNTLANRFENNIIQGFKEDGLDYTANDLTGTLPVGQATRNATDNYVGKNTIVATSLAAGLAGGSAFWANCGSHNTWLFGNEVRGSKECGLTVWLSNSNMLLGNTTYDHGYIGVCLSGGTETDDFCGGVGGGVGAYNTKPKDNYIRNNYSLYNVQEQFLIRSVDNTDLSLNFALPTLGRTGPQKPPQSQSAGQAAWFLQTDLAEPTSNGFRVAGNISMNNTRGVWDDDNKNDPGLEYYLNRHFNSSLNRFITAAPLNFDAGPTIGGNFWTQQAATGNPSASTPYGGVFPNVGNTPGLIVDRYPFQSEDLGRGHGVFIAEPRAGSIFARGTRRTVRWYAQGCIWVDILFDTTPIITDTANTGYAVVTIPLSASIGNHSIVVVCKDSSALARSAGGSSTFSVVDESLQLMAPGRDDVFNGGGTIFVAWKKTAAVGAVDVQISTDGTTFANATLAAGGAATGLTTTFARIALPNVSTATAAIRVVSGATYRDQTDGIFAIRAGTVAFTNVPPGRKISMGLVERLEWTSPVNSRLVTITANGVPIATKLPDRGYFDWLPKDFGAAALSLGIAYYDSSGTVALGSANNFNASLIFAGLITFGQTTTIAPGSTQSVTATANSGAAVTLSSLTPSICSIAGTTATAISTGTCIIAGSAPATATFSAASTVTTKFTVGAVSGRLTAISTRLQVLTGDNVLIGGFIIGGVVPKKVVVNARGPSLTQAGVAGAISDPFLQLVRASDNTVTSNDNWTTSPNAAEIQALGLNPPNSFESSILQTLQPGAYTAIVSGASGVTGVGIVEVFEVDQPTIPITGISTRGLVQTGENVMIAGFIIQGSAPLQVVVRARGPSLGLPGTISDPTLTLVPPAGPTVVNDNWQTAANAAALQASGYAPSSPFESAILVTLNPGAYTAIMSGMNGSTGVGIVEVYVVP